MRYNFFKSFSLQAAICVRCIKRSILYIANSTMLFETINTHLLLNNVKDISVENFYQNEWAAASNGLRVWVVYFNWRIEYPCLKREYRNKPDICLNVGRNGDIKWKITACGLKPPPINIFFSVFQAVGESVVWTVLRVIKFLMDFTWLTAQRKFNFKVKLEVYSDSALLRCVMQLIWRTQYDAHGSSFRR